MSIVVNPIMRSTIEATDSIHTAPSSTNPATSPRTDQQHPQTSLSSSKRANPMKTLTVCRYYFLGGCLFLPILWMINFFWFFSEAFRPPPPGSGANTSSSPVTSSSDETNTTGGGATAASVVPAVDESEERKRIRYYVTLSGVGSAVWILLLSVWIYIYQTHRAQWGEWGDSISAIIPRGKP